ncbi:MAG: efflux RND transporter periplasmic adaptor subunit [Deltaproteobacteria bacterium]|nr:efflux RND transporter periplasmic adaptor subunit [Deltaproteobacteria bacterium]
MRHHPFSARFIALALLLFAAGALPGCREEEERATVIEAPPVMLTPVVARDIVDRVEATGQLTAKAEAKIAAQVGGQITSIAAREGDAVEAGQVVLEIDPGRRQLEHASQTALVAEAKAALVESERELERIRKLRSSNAASAAQLDAAETILSLSRARLEAARAQLGLAARALADSSVRAPFAGLIARRYVSRGEFVSMGHKLFDLVALDPVEVEFHLSEVDSSLVELGDPVGVRLAPFPDEVFAAVVTVIAPIIDPASRTLRVKAELANPAGRLRPGLFARADLGVSERSGVPMVPEDVILQRSDGAVVFRMAGAQTVQRVNVQLGVHRDGLVEIRAGLAAGDQVVIRGQTSLIDGSVVSLRNADGSAVVAVGAEADEKAAR